MRTRPVIALSATLALLGGGSAVGAVADPQDAPAAGAATSTVTLLDVGLGGRNLSVLELALRSDTLSGTPSTAFVVTPLTLDGTTYGRQAVSSRSAAVPAADSRRLAPAALSALAAARSPLVDVTVDGGTSRAGTTSLGDLSVLGMPLTMDGSASISSVVDATGATGGKTLTVTELALPSLADLLAALGLDLRTLPTGSLTGLLDGLDLSSAVTAAAQAELDRVLAPVQPRLAPAQDAVVRLTDEVEAALEQVAAAQAALAPATTALNDATRALPGPTTAGLRRGSLVGLEPLPTAPITTVIEPVTAPVVEAAPLPAPPTEPVATALVTDTVALVQEPVTSVDQAMTQVTEVVTAPVSAPLPTVEALLPLPAELPPALQPAADAHAVAKKAYDDALQAVRAAEAALATANGLLSTAKATVAGLLAPYQAQVDALVEAVVGVLDSTPLLRLDRLEVTTRSAVTSAAVGGQSAQVVGGEVQGLRVLGTDVLQSTLGTSEVEVLDLAGPVKAKVDAAVTQVTGTLSSVLSQVPGLPTLEVPAPKVDLLTRATSTDVVDGYGVAGSALRAVTVSWPGLAIPAEAARAGAATLPAVAGATTLPALRRASAVGDVVSQPLTLSLATLEDRARFRPAQLSLQPGGTAPTTGTPTTGGGTPTTGTPTTGTLTTGAPTSGTPSTSTPAGTTTSRDTAARAIVATGAQLPRTGAEPSVLALLLVAAGLALHRRYRTA